jgi:hypothetical protein
MKTKQPIAPKLEKTLALTTSRRNKLTIPKRWILIS